MKLHKLILTAIAGSLLFVSCTSDDDNKEVPSGAYDNGILVLNQGVFLQGNSSVSFISDAMTVENNIYANVNPGTPLGDVGQDIGLHGDHAYIVVNNSNMIVVVNRYTMAKIATITTDLVNPRYITFYNGKGYVTNWGTGGSPNDDYVAVLDLNSNVVTSKIPVVEGPEKIIEENGKLYVAHAGGWNQNDKISVINLSNNNVETITVGAVPNSLEVENGNLYVVSSGMPSWATETAGRIDVINLANNTVTKTIPFAGIEHPSNLQIEDSKLYYTVSNKIYRMDLSASTLPAQPLFTTAGQNVLNISGFTVENGHIYIGDAKDNVSNGEVYIYTMAGAVENHFTVGLIPSGFYFND